MNMRLFAVLGVVACAAVTGCVVVGNTPDGTGGNGGNGAGVGGAGGSSSSSSAGGAGQGGQGGSGGAPACVTCSEAVTNGGTACMGTSTDLYNKLADCACGMMGNCATACSKSTCMGLTPDMDCATCVQQTTEANGGCQESFNACAADF